MEILDFDLTDDDLKVLRTKSAFNSFEAYAASFTNLSVMMMMYGDYELARLCCLRSIDLLPDDKEAHINMNNIMRQIGRKEEAFDYVWSQLDYKIEGFQRPVHLDCRKDQSFKYEFGHTQLIIVCVKYGTKYGADYVNKLYRGVQRNLTLPHKFVCFTENPEGLEEGVTAIAL